MKFKNLIIHLVVISISFLLLMPSVWLLNKSYYTSISKVNYWEEKQIVGLLSYILKNMDVSATKVELINSMESVKFLAIKIERGSEVIIDKKIDGAKVDDDSTKIYKINNYKISIMRRKYPDYLSDYKKYLNCFLALNYDMYTNKSSLLNDNKSFLYHHNLVILIVHLVLILIVEIMLLNISIKYRFHQISKEIGA